MIIVQSMGQSGLGMLNFYHPCVPRAVGKLTSLNELFKGLSTGFLQQEFPRETWCPLGFFFRELSSIEKRHSAYNLVLLRPYSHRYNIAVAGPGNSMLLTLPSVPRSRLCRRYAVRVSDYHQTKILGNN